MPLPKRNLSLSASDESAQIDLDHVGSSLLADAALLSSEGASDSLPLHSPEIGESAVMHTDDLSSGDNICGNMHREDS